MPRRKTPENLLPSFCLLHNLIASPFCHPDFGPKPPAQGPTYATKEKWYEHLREYARDGKCRICTYLKDKEQFDPPKELALMAEAVFGKKKAVWGRWL